jgi:hypothetical protein
MDRIQRLPVELLLEILVQAGPRACARIACASRGLWRIVAERPGFWRYLFLLDFPLDDREYEWLAWCQRALDQEEYQRPAQSPASPIVWYGPKVRWLRLFGRRVLTEQNWRHMTYRMDRIRWPGYFTRKMWRRMSIWKISASGSLFYLDNNDLDDMDEDNVDSDDEDMVCDGEDMDKTAYTYGEPYTSQCDGRASTTATDKDLRTGPFCQRQISSLGGRLFVLPYQPNAEVLELQFGPGLVCLSSCRPPIVRMERDYIIVEGDAAPEVGLGFKAQGLGPQRRIWIWRMGKAQPILVLGNGPTSQSACCSATASNKASMTSTLSLVDALGDWILCRRIRTCTTQPAHQLIDYLVYDLTTLAGQDPGAPHAGHPVSVAHGATSAHLQQVLGEPRMSSLGLPVRNVMDLRQCKHPAPARTDMDVENMMDQEEHSVLVYSHYVQTNPNPAPASAYGNGSRHTRMVENHIFWKTERVITTDTTRTIGTALNSDVLYRAYTVAQGSYAVTLAPTMMSSPIESTRVDDDRILLRMHAETLDIVWIGLFSLKDQHIQWEHQGNFQRVDVFPGYGFLTVCFMETHQLQQGEQPIEEANEEMFIPKSKIQYACGFGRTSTPTNGVMHAKQHWWWRDRQQATARGTSINTRSFPCSTSCASTENGRHYDTAYRYGLDDHLFDGLPLRQIVLESALLKHYLATGLTSTSYTCPMRKTNLNTNIGATPVSNLYEQVQEHQHQRVRYHSRLLRLSDGEPMCRTMSRTGPLKMTRIIGTVALISCTSDAHQYFRITDALVGQDLCRFEIVQCSSSVVGLAHATHATIIDTDVPGWCWRLAFTSISAVTDHGREVDIAASL